jgi:hypothetical protein
MSNSLDQGGDRVLHIVGKMLSKAISLFTRGSEEVRSQQLYSSLCRDVDLNWAALLRRRSGTVRIGTPPPRTYFDYAVCSVEFQDFILQVIRGRGETRVQIKSSNRGDWQELQEVLQIAIGSPSTLSPQDGLATFADAILQNWESLTRVLTNS